MTSQEVFEAFVLGSEIAWKGKRWIIQSTFQDATADLERRNKMGDIEFENAPIARLKLAEKVKDNAM